MTADKIWDGDLFGRRVESEQLIGFLETVATRPSFREDGNAYVLAVDAPYGEGKSYFLRRFALHMALSHPVAFVDAWVDDLEDEPLVALAATLERAFVDYPDDSGELKKRIDRVIYKTGQVAKIAGTGLIKRGIGLLITPTAVDAVGAVIGEVSDSTSEGIGKGIDDILDDASGEIKKTATVSMHKRIEKFNEGRAAVEEMKQSLRDLVHYLTENRTYPPPIVIVIDELDRCRPTYAVKLLEEVKHLFDVNGLAFVLGMHGQALSHSVSAAYGTGFDGKSYLGRFLNRRYTLRDASVYALLSSLISARNLSIQRLKGWSVVVDDQNVNKDVIYLISLLMKSSGLNARDVFGVVDSLEVCLALTDHEPLFVPYLIPLILNKIRGLDGMAEVHEEQRWLYVSVGPDGRETKWTPNELAAHFYDAANLTVNELMTANNQINANLVVKLVYNATFNGESAKLSSPKNYKRLLETVDRFVDRT